MIYQDGISFVEEVDYPQLYGGFGFQEDYMAIEAMSSHGKQQQYVFGIFPNFCVLMISLTGVRLQSQF